MIRRFRPDELAGTADVTDAELAGAWAAARELEAFADASSVGPSDGFEARVMAAVAEEPLPAPVVAAGHAARRGRFPAVLAALVDAWRVAFGGGRPLGARVQALAVVLIVFVAAGSLGSLALVGSWNALAPTHSPELSPAVSPAPTATPSPSPSPTATPTPEPSDAPSESVEPTDSAEPTETPGATSEAGSGPGSAGSATATPRPTAKATPSPTHEDSHTPEPTHTPDPSQTPDSGGGGEDHGSATPTPASTPTSGG